MTIRNNWNNIDKILFLRDNESLLLKVISCQNKALYYSLSKEINEEFNITTKGIAKDRTFYPTLYILFNILKAVFRQNKGEFYWK